MPFNRPTLSQIRERASADIDRHAEGNPYLPRSIEFALANALAGISHELHGAIQFYADQIFDDTAEDEFILRRAAPYGLTLIEAYSSVGTATATGNEGADIEAGEELLAPNGELYSVDATVTITGGTATVAVTAKTPGAAANQVAGTKLTFTTPITGIDSEVVVDTGLTGGADQESIERFKQRFEERKQTPPKGGSDDDYIAWAKQGHVDITRVWPHSHKNPAGATEYGSVLLYMVTDDLASTIPTQPILDAVYDYIHLPGIRPAGAKNVYVEAPAAKALNLTFDSLTPNTAAVQAAIEAEIKDLLKREAVPGGAIKLSHIREAISIAAGEDDFSLTTPTTDFTTATGEIATLGVITWPGA